MRDGKSAFLRGGRILPPPVTGDMSAAELVETALIKYFVSARMPT